MTTTDTAQKDTQASSQVSAFTSSSTVSCAQAIKLAKYHYSSDFNTTLSTPVHPLFSRLAVEVLHYTQDLARLVPICWWTTKPAQGNDMDQEYPPQSAHPSDSTSIFASPETMSKPLSPHPTMVPQSTTENKLSSGSPEAASDKDSSESRLEDIRMSTPASEISEHDTDLRPSDDTQDAADTTGEQAFYKRELRPTRGTAPCTYIDADTTGDFDPLEEARKARPKRKKAKLSHRGKHDWNGEENTDEPAIEFGLELPPPPPLCLRFNSPAGKNAFSKLCEKLEREVKPSHDKWTAGYQLRKRKSISEGPFSGALTVQSTGVRVIASEQTSDFTNHPVARGCFDCLAHGVRCSLLDDEHSWPCEECVINDNDCQLVKVCRPLRAIKFQLLTILTGARVETGLHALPISRQEEEVAVVLVYVRQRSFWPPRSMHRVQGKRSPAVYRRSRAQPSANKDTHRTGRRAAHERTKQWPKGFS